MKICIISDFHCKHDINLDESSETLLFTNQPRIPKEHHPIAAMVDLIKNNFDKLKCDSIFFLGDLGHQADEQGVVTGWQFVDEIKREIGAQTLIGIPGNHDINSRKIRQKEPFDFIVNFHEEFPTVCGACNDKFWNQGFCIYQNDKTLVLMINTVKGHSDEENSKRSEITQATISKINQELSKINTKKAKICILHHHLIKHSNIKNWKDHDSLEKGDLLIPVLKKYDFSLVIHGHKHQPRIRNYEGLPVFASGSFSCFSNLQGTSYKTMFHIVELDDTNNKLGEIYSWEYNIESGWEQGTNRHFPSRIGFGHNINHPELAKKIGDIIKLEKGPVTYFNIISKFPELKHILPNDLIKINEILKSDFDLTTSPEWPLEPVIFTPY